MHQLDKICRSPELSSKQQLCRLLRYLVRETLEGREENLKGFTIGLEVFKKGDNFNPEQDPIVRIHAGRLRRMLKLYYLEKGKDDDVIIEIPKGKYIPVFVPKAEVTVSSQAEMPWDDHVNLAPSVAVLPFSNLDRDPANDYFARGFSVELSVELSKFEELVVYELRPPALAMSSPSDPWDFIRERQIRFILDGGVQMEKDRIKVLAKLIDTGNDKQVWGERYVRSLSADNLIDIQENIVKEIAEIVGSEFGIIFHTLNAHSNRIKPKHLDTYNAVLKFYQFEEQRTRETILDAFHALEGALKNDPGSGIAMAMLASLYGNLYALDYPDAEKAYRMAGDLAVRAKELDPNSLLVRAIMVFIHLLYDEKEKFIDEVDLCLAMSPKNTIKLGAIGFHLCLFGYWDRGKAILDKVMKANISYPVYLHGATALYFYRKKQYRKALAEANKYKIPALFWGPLLRASILGQMGKMKEARENLDDLFQLKPDFDKKAEYLISRFVKEPAVVKHVIKGLAKAGMTVPVG